MSEHAPPVESFLEDGDLTAAAWGRALREQVILGQACSDCGHKTAAPKAACARCGSRNIAVVQLPRDGRVYAETTIEVPPGGFDGAYTIALISLGEGDARILGRVTGDATIGDHVSLAGIIDNDERGHPSPVFE